MWDGEEQSVKCRKEGRRGKGRRSSKGKLVECREGRGNTGIRDEPRAKGREKGRWRNNIEGKEGETERGRKELKES